MNLMLLRTFALSLALIAAPAAAHPLLPAGSGFLAGFAHPFAGFDHLLAMFAVGAWAARMGGRALWAIPLCFVGTMVLGGALGLNGISLPNVEPMLAASVLALGLLVLSGRTVGAVPGTLLVVCFAAFHGLAHAGEMPVAVSAIAYALGFMAATAVLHAAGVGAALWMKDRARLVGAPIALCGCWWLARVVA